MPVYCDSSLLTVLTSKENLCDPQELKTLPPPFVVWCPGFSPVGHINNIISNLNW